MANTYLALLRGINVGGNNKLPMKDLVEMFVAAGASDVRAYIQSGNVIFRANVGLAERVPGLISVRIDKRWGYRTPVVPGQRQGRSQRMWVGAVSSHALLRAVDTPAGSRPAAQGISRRKQEPPQAEES